MSSASSSFEFSMPSEMSPTIASAAAATPSSSAWSETPSSTSTRVRLPLPLTSSRSTFSVNRNAVSLLSARACHGLDAQYKHVSSWKGSLSRGALPNRMNDLLLSSVVTWNRSRLQNMILVVGSNTPASVISQSSLAPSNNNSSSNSNSSSSSNNNSDDEGDMIVDQDEDGNFVLLHPFAAQESDDDENEDEDENEDADVIHESSDDEDGGMIIEGTNVENLYPAEGQIPPAASENENEEGEDGDEGTGMFHGPTDEDDNDENRPIFNFYQTVRRHHWRPYSRHRFIRHPTAAAKTPLNAPLIRHSGCINTACWLDVPWRLSTSTNSFNNPDCRIPVEALDSRECPTQLITSGDDRVVKVWDVSGVMGMENPLPGGWNTFCPLSTNKLPSSLFFTHREWKNVYSPKSHNPSPLRVAGTVRHLATLSTGHRANVFHASPLPCHPGKLLTCAADGHLRMCDLVAESSAEIVYPSMMVDFLEDRSTSSRAHFGMAYSHKLLSPNTGLLCSDGGLFHFDVRLRPPEQLRSSLIADFGAKDGSHRRSVCKACAVWSPYGSKESSSQFENTPGSGGAVESYYVFAGGASETVGLYDMRIGGSRCQSIERYKPNCLESNGQVSVSGLDVSKDGSELLVSYESDQIYSFPILQSSLLSKGRAKIGTISMQDIEKLENDNAETVSELASYGSHLNRFTFLKNAQYAGPNDEYICTGSDAGHAWIFERNTGTVASLLGADSTTCNGVIPHPSLPFFITYGIDSTAKVWRATRPVDPDTDDSAAGRLACLLHQDFEISPVARHWDGVLGMLNTFSEDPAIMPDMIASSEEVVESGRFSSSCRRGMCGIDTPRLGNFLRSLPMILRQHHYECYLALNEELELPVQQPLGFTHRASLSRLHNQAERLGVKWQPWAPWAFVPSEKNCVHPADLVPDFPSDWINYDPAFRRDVFPPRAPFNCVYYQNGLTEHYFPDFFDGEDEHKGTPPWLTHSMTQEVAKESSVSATESTEASMTSLRTSSREILYKTVQLLKEAGNEAMKDGLLQTAARRYDKAIQYCGVQFMQYRDRSRLYLNGEDLELFDKSNVITEWSPLLILLITSRLNLSLVLLKPDIGEHRFASVQATAAIKLLVPFTVKKGKVARIRDKTEIILKEHEPEEHYFEAMALKAKALFRLGSCQLAANDYSGAIHSFESSLKCSSYDPKFVKSDPLTSKRLKEAKRRQLCRKKRDQAKFKRMFCNDNESDDSSS